MNYQLPIVIVLSAIFASCNFAEPVKKATEIDEDIKKASELLEKSIKAKVSSPIWAVEFDKETGEWSPIRSRSVSADSLDEERIIKVLQATYPEIGPINTTRINKDTLIVELPNSIYLTQQMGSSGAQEFLMVATYSFTELSSVNQVLFDFAEGDHAAPGIYGRYSW